MSALVLLSGGMDSAVLAFRAKRHGYLAATLFVDYGQPAIEKESRAAWGLSRELGCRHFERHVRLELADMAAPEGAVGPRVVPARNLVFLSLGINAAMTCGATMVLLGATADDSADYSDCWPQFAEMVNKVSATFHGVNVRYPFAEKTKAEVVKLGRELGLDFTSTWSCYTPTASHGQACGRCNACKQRTAVLKTVVLPR